MLLLVHFYNLNYKQINKQSKIINQKRHPKELITPLKNHPIIVKRNPINLPSKPKKINPNTIKIKTPITSIFFIFIYIKKNRIIYKKFKILNINKY